MGSSVKLSDIEIQLLKEVQTHLVRNGLKQIESLNVRCVKCHMPLDGVQLGAVVWECKRCGHSEKGIRLGVDGTIALGAVAGVAALGLLSWMQEQDDRQMGRSDATLGAGSSGSSFNNHPVGRSPTAVKPRSQR